MIVPHPPARRAAGARNSNRKDEKFFQVITNHKVSNYQCMNF